MNQKLNFSDLKYGEFDHFINVFNYDRRGEETRIVYNTCSRIPLCTCQTTHEFVLLVKELYKRKHSILRDFKELNVSSMLEEIRNKIGGKQNEN